jgi:hypothetical protein
MGKEREMVAKNKSTTGKGQVKKLRLKKETIRDLDVKAKASGVKGGARVRGGKTEGAGATCASVCDIC